VQTVPQQIETALAFHASGQLDEAEKIYREVLTCDPNNADALHLIGVMACERGNYDEAVNALQRALAVRPSFAEVLNNLGLALQAQGNIGEATTCYRKALSIRPDYADAFNNLGLALSASGKLHDAIVCYRQAIQSEPTHHHAVFNLANALKAAKKLDDAVAHYLRALDINPNYVDAWVNLGNTYGNLGRYNEALGCLRRALSLDPNSAEAHWNHASPLLLTGDFERGWSEYEWRWKTWVLPAREFRCPRWTGEPLLGKTILLHAEQGLGDTIQFVRYAPMVQRLGAKVIVECQKPLPNILTTCRGIDQLIPEDGELPAFDFHSPLLSLPAVFKTTLETIPAEVPYLFADEELISRWRQRLQSVEGFRIGVNWHGRENHEVARRRDIPLDLVASLAKVPGVKLISLQKGIGQQELDAAPNRWPILSLGEFDTEHGAFMDTAAVMMDLDMVISSDTAVPHIAGALGVPVWVALPFVPDWRWLLDRSDSPWYPTMRLFRQTKLGDWQGPFEEIKAALRDAIQSKVR
jgi:tetratricopeptide (TPR) repeat protein